MGDHINKVLSKSESSSEVKFIWTNCYYFTYSEISDSITSFITLTVRVRVRTQILQKHWIFPLLLREASTSISILGRRPEVRKFEFGLKWAVCKTCQNYKGNIWRWFIISMWVFFCRDCLPRSGYNARILRLFKVRISLSLWRLCVLTCQHRQL